MPDLSAIAFNTEQQEIAICADCFAIAQTYVT